MDFPNKQNIVKSSQKALGVVVDGIAGRQTWGAIAAFYSINTANLNVGSIILAVQRHLGLVADAKDGPKTWGAIFDSLVKKEVSKDPVVDSGNKRKVWPKANQSAIEKFYGKMGENLVSIDLPYPMVLSWDTKVVVNKMTCHKKCAETFKSMFQDILDHYGMAEIKRLGLDKFGGCFNKRKMRGGSEWSHHSWAVVLDLDPDNNQLNWGKDKAHFAKPEYKAFWEIVYSYGMTGLGPERNYDFQHIGCIDYRR